MVVETKLMMALAVDGQEPVAQGSMSSIVSGRWNAARTWFTPYLNKRNGMPIVSTTASNAKTLDPWRRQVAAEARDAWGGQEWLDDVDVFVSVEFRFSRLKSHYGTGRNASILKALAPFFKHTKPDVDKLQRSVFDALTEAQVWRDDSLVVDVHARKVYDTTPGLRLWVSVPKTKDAS